MSWGARSLARAAAVILLLELATGSTAATLQRAIPKNTSTNAAVVATTKHKRDSDTLSEVLIEHVNNVDEPQAALSLFIGFLILGAIVLVVLIFLGCLFLLRLSESQSAKYHRLCSKESRGSFRRSRADNSGPSQVFTYVDLSNADGGRLNHRDDCEHSQAPRFSAIFTTVTNARAKNTESRREPKRRRSSGSRTTRLVAMGLPPSAVSAVDTPSFRRDRSHDDTASLTDVECVSTAERTTEPPKKRICVQKVTGMPTQASGSVRTAQGFEEYGERCTKLDSGVPQMEIKVRERVLKRFPDAASSRQEWAPIGSGLTPGADETTERSTTLTHNRYYPEGAGTHEAGPSVGPYGQSGSWSEIISPLFSPDDRATEAPLFSNQPNAIKPSDNALQGSSRLQPERKDLSGHGRFYEQHVPGREGRTASKADEKSRLGLSTNSDLVPYGNTAVIPSDGTVQRPVNALERTSAIEPESRNGVPAPSSNPEMRSLLGNEASHVKPAWPSSGKPVEASSPPVTPVKIKANVTLQRAPSQGPSTVGSPLHSEPRELSVQLPEMIAYFDRPQMAKSYKATIGGSSASNAATKVSSPDAQWMTPAVAGGSLSSSSSDNRALSRKLELSPPPIEPRGGLQTVPHPSEESAIIVRSPRSAAKHRDGRSSTQSHSLDDVSQQRSSLLQRLSGSDIRPGDREKRNVFATMSALDPHSESSLVASDLKLSTETVLAGSNTRVEPRSSQGLPGISHSPADSVANALEQKEQPPERTASELTVSTVSQSAKLTGGEIVQTASYSSDLQMPTGSRAPVGPVEESVHSIETPLYDDPIALKAEVTVEGAWPIVTSDGKHIEVLRPTSTEVAKRDQLSSTGPTQSSAIQCAPDRKILSKDRPQTPERKFNAGEDNLTPLTRNTEQHFENTQGRQLVSDPAHRATIEPRTEDTHFPARKSSQGSSSAAELTERPTLPPNYIDEQAPSESATRVNVERRQVSASPVHQKELVSLSPSSSRTGGAIVQMKPSETQVSGISRSLATSGERDLNVTPSGAGAGSRELETSAAQQASLVSPGSSQTDGTIVQQKPSDMQVSGISPTLASTGERNLDMRLSAGSTGSRELATSAARQPTLVSPRSSEIDGTIVQFKPSENQISGISRTVAASGKKDLDVTAGVTTAGSHELEMTAAHQATLAPPTSSLNGGSIDLVDQSKSSALQAAESSHGLTVSGAREVTPNIGDAAAQQRIVSSEQFTQDTTAATREDHPGPSHAESMTTLPLSERADSTDVFFATASPVASQSSKDLISFNSDETRVQQTERTTDIPTGTDGRNKGASPPQTGSSNDKPAE